MPRGRWSCCSHHALAPRRCPEHRSSRVHRASFPAVFVSSSHSTWFRFLPPQCRCCGVLACSSCSDKFLDLRALGVIPATPAFTVSDTVLTRLATRPLTDAMVGWIETPESGVVTGAPESASGGEAEADSGSASEEDPDFVRGGALRVCDLCHPILRTFARLGSERVDAGGPTDRLG